MGDRSAAATRVLVLALVASASPPGAIGALAQPEPAILAIPTQVGLPVPGVADYEMGHVQYQGTVELSIVIPGNQSWIVFVRSDDPDLGGYGKPVGDLLVRRNGVPTWMSASNVEQVLATGNGSQFVQVDVAIALAWSADPPDVYGGTLVFRVRKN